MKTSEQILVLLVVILSLSNFYFIFIYKQAIETNLAELAELNKTNIIINELTPQNNRDVAATAMLAENGRYIVPETNVSFVLPSNASDLVYRTDDRFYSVSQCGEPAPVDCVIPIAVYGTENGEYGISVYELDGFNWGTPSSKLIVENDEFIVQFGNAFTEVDKNTFIYGDADVGAVISGLVVKDGEQVIVIDTNNEALTTDLLATLLVG